MRRYLPLLISLLPLSPVTADTGMNPLALGAEGEALAGACLSCDEGVPGTMSNPATLGVTRAGHRSDFGLSLFSPGFTRTENGVASSSRRQQLWFPSLSWATRRERFSYGAGVFRQGGLATFYRNGDTAPPERAELQATRVVAPLALQVSDRLIIGGSIGFSSMEMDLQWLVPGSEFAALLQGAGTIGTVSSTMAATLGGMISSGVLQASGIGAGPANALYVDFYNPDQFAGGASATGHGGYFGALYRLDSATSLAFFYHGTTRYSTLYGQQADLSVNLNMDDNYIAGTWDGAGTGTAAGTYSAADVQLRGHIRLRSFLWPAMHGFGISHDGGIWQVHGAVRYIAWASAMDALRMEFVADELVSGPGDNLVGQRLDLKWRLNWRDQQVYAIGAALSLWPGGSLRGGYSYATSPIRNHHLHPLLPAITRRHYTLGIGQQLGEHLNLDAAFSLAVAPEQHNTYTSPGTSVRQAGRSALFTLTHYY